MCASVLHGGLVLAAWRAKVDCVNADWSKEPISLLYAFGMQLINIMFSPPSSLLYASKKSKRFGLDREWVDKLLCKLPFNLNVTIRTYYL